MSGVAPVECARRGGALLRVVCETRAALGGHLYLTASQGHAELVASHELPAPDARLADCVREYVVEQDDRFDTQTVAVHGPPALDTAPPLTRVDGVDYELLLPSRFTERGAEIRGVVALAPGPQGKPNSHESQLLAWIAEQLG